MSASDPPVTQLPLRVRPEPARVVIRPFTPADDPSVDDPARRSRRGLVIQRILNLAADDLAAELAHVLTSLTDRHAEVRRVLLRRYREVVGPAPTQQVSDDQALLIGAYFSEEYSFEAAALFNPSIVPHPDQTGAPPGALRFVMSLRGVGEGHVSSITFRTGLFTARGEVVLTPPSATAASPQIDYIPGGAPDDPGVRLFCGSVTDLSEIVIFPVTYHQRHGMEDLRLVRFVDEGGNPSYIGTYTAFSGEAARQELLRTTDFVTFELSALRGPAAATKGLALFPHRIDGSYAMLGRNDHDSIWLLKSNDLYHWSGGTRIITPRWPWEIVQIGNCGSPIELDEGWLVLIHGVGPVRNYCLGACLLDKHDPTRLLGRSRRPLISTEAGDRDGYVPNVVYSCGALLHERTLLLPFGIADSYTAFASIGLDELLRSLA